MGCALKLFQKSRDKKQELEKRFLILGLDNAGKTSILQRIAQKEASAPAPTVGLNVESVKHRDVDLTFWDVGGAATILWKHYYQDVDAIVFVIDSSDAVRLPDAKAELLRVLDEPALAEVPLLLYGNKQDVPAAMKDGALSAALDFDALNRKYKLLQMCSAKENKGIVEGLDKLLDTVLHRTPQGK